MCEILARANKTNRNVTRFICSSCLRRLVLWLRREGKKKKIDIYFVLKERKSHLRLCFAQDGKEDKRQSLNKWQMKLISYLFLVLLHQFSGTLKSQPFRFSMPKCEKRNISSLKFECGKESLSHCVELWFFR